MRILLLLSLFGASLCSSDDAFLSFVKEFKKGYKSLDEFNSRRAIFDKNHKDMLEHNKRYAAGEETWWQKVVEDMDLTEEEWMAKRTGGLPNIDDSTVFTDTLDERIVAKMEELGPAPRKFSWVDQGMVSSVKNQGQCGSCAAFSVMGAVESCFSINGDPVDDLSEQHILDCAYNHYVNDEYGSWGAFGCDGAWPNAYVDWLMNGKYNQEESSYPYRSGNSGVVYGCNPSSNGYHTNSQVTGMYNRWYPDEMEMENTVQMNPVSTSVSATNNWSRYGGGVLDDRSCCNAASDSNCVYNLNHAILVVGYGHDSSSGLDYWIIKNSWGGRWGESGYVRLKKGTGHCGVGSLHQTLPYCG